ncbi:transcriptional regulator with XRE-family HTH domain [Diaminobutyricimonas aerilata]|uniref:Transcriptional regulator with XRE-family HTH domain n=1 Tax=Diaminobutyricimonas aerilata TaxID=1162967 RepID=A0A2M9CM73_9MICO|nr:helix-turn-helix transcriptional regulator [Diaminobutyricimonas aerilata]PJJ72958.1 transcriptional regulator with XRE-family HTH domain [Diaminobutyricimonas aerilata]
MTDELGAFLRASRNRTDPARHGFGGAVRRRVAGLRREEVAALAGVSVDYYTRLEQGRETRPSLQVVDALAGVFDLDRDARQHVYRLAGLMPIIDLAPSGDAPSPELRQLLDAWPHTPAVVFNHAYDVLASNRIGEALFAPFDPERNLLLSVFLDPGARSFYDDWPAAARNSAGALRFALGQVPDDRRLLDVLETLLRHSVEFRRLWDDPEVRGKSMEFKRLNHPQVGLLELTMQTFEVRSAPGQQLIVYHPAPGSRSDDGLRILGTLAETASRRLLEDPRSAGPSIAGSRAPALAPDCCVGTHRAGSVRER